MDMNRKFKQGWSTSPPISTKQTTTYSRHVGGFDLAIRFLLPNK
jgi:hypothetical protein